MLRFWSSKLHFWRKSRRKASFLSFKASFLKEVSHKSFVFDLQSFFFEGSLAEKLRFWASKLHFWRKSRRKALFLSFKASILKDVSQKASFLSFKASILKEVSQKSFVFELQSFIFEGSLAEKLRFWSSKLHSWRKSSRKALFLSFKASILKDVSQKASFLRFKALFLTSQIRWQPNRLNLKFDNQTRWQPNHLNPRSFDNQTTWISNHSTSKSIEFRINWEPKSLESQITWQPNHLHLKSDDNQITWIPNQMTTKPFDSQFTWTWHQLTFEHWTPHTSSYRFIMVGNFRHCLARSICYTVYIPMSSVLVFYLMPGFTLQYKSRQRLFFWRGMMVISIRCQAELKSQKRIVGCWEIQGLEDFWRAPDAFFLPGGVAWEAGGATESLGWSKGRRTTRRKNRHSGEIYYSGY